MAVNKMRPRITTAPPTIPIPDKLYFKIGEVAELVGVPAHVLRYWEREVSAIRPGKSASRQRRYRYKDVEIFREIRRLLYQDRYTLAGARRRLGEIGQGNLGKGQPEHDAEQDVEQAHAQDQTHELNNVEAAVAQEPVPAPVEDTVAAPPSLFRPSRAPQLHLGFPTLSDDDRRERLRTGLRELIRLAGEEP